MNKKFLSAIMCGAMLTASTSVFVSCEDYGDDIAHLQEQIDQNAATSASELAGKVAALEGQISTLKAAQDNMKDQLAEAKAQAAAAANEAAAAAAKAQAAADAAQSGAADAKAAAAAAQAAADAANKGLADAVARVAVLETKVASLEATIAGLTASDKELTAKLNDLQVMANSLKGATDANTEEIKAIKAEIAAKTAELAGQVAKISAEFGAKIDAINAELNTIKANYATKNELNEKAAELAAIDATLAEQIAANEAYIAAMQEAIAALEAEDAELAALIAENQAAALAEIEAINEELAAQKEAVEAELATINEKIEALDDVVASLVTIAAQNQETIAGLAQEVADVQEVVSGLLSQDVAFTNQLAEIMGYVSDHDELISALQKQDVTVQTQFAEVMDAIFNLGLDVEELGEGMEAVNTVLVQLNAQMGENMAVVDAAIQALTTDVVALQEWTAAYDAKYAEFVEATNTKIAEELKVLEEKFSADLVAAKADIAELKEQMAAVLGRIQSIAFVPEYMNAEGNVIVPSYYYNQKNANIVGGVFKATPINVKFRVQPAEAAEALAALWADEETRECFSLECANQLQTRAAANGYVITKVAGANGVITVTGETTGATDNFTTGTWAYTLVVEDALATKKTSDYFNVETQAIDLTKVTATHAHENIEFTDFAEYNPTTDMTISYVTVGNLATGDKVSLAGLGRASNLRIEAVKVGGQWVSLWANTYKYANGTSVYSAAEVDAINTTLTNFWANAGKYFVPVTAANNDVQVKGLTTGSVVDKNGINSEIELLVVDQNFGRDNTAGKTTPAWGWQKSYEVRHKITENKTATSLYNFNNEGNKLAWRFQEPAGTHHEVFAANGLEWLKYGISSAPALAPTAIDSKISIKEIAYRNGVKASVAQVKEVLTAAIAADNATNLKRAGVAYGNVTFAMDGDAVKATVSFNNNIPYGHTYTFTKEYATVFGKITLEGIVKLTINGATQEDMLKHTINWKGASAYNLGITNPYMNATPVKYVPDWSFDKGYDNYTKYTQDKACTYEWYLLPAVVGGGTLNNSTNINSVSSALSTVVLEDASQIKGYKFNLGKVMFDRYITAEYTKDTKVYTVKGSAALAKLQFVTIVKDWNGNVVAHEIGQFNYVDPIQAPVLDNIAFTAEQCKNIVNEPLIICGGINVTDIYNQPWYVAGELDATVQTVWGAKDVVYSIENAAEVAKVAGDLYIDATDKDAVKVVFSNYQWASDLVVTVKASIEYSYGLVESTFNVTLPANPTLQ